MQQINDPALKIQINGTKQRHGDRQTAPQTAKGSSTQEKKIWKGKIQSNVLGEHLWASFMAPEQSCFLKCNDSKAQ